MSLEPGQIIEGKYRIIRLLGEGGMGAVYEGENTRIHRTVAIKVLHAGVAAKEDVVQRFEREAQAAGRIGSEHIVEVLDLGSLAEGERFMVMEFMDGEDLGTRIKKQGRLEPSEAGPIMLQLLEGLAAAHEASIIHRDLKPDNVYLIKSRGGQKDFVKILDFGVSKFSALDTEMSMTRTGAVMGTPYYMSPEQARGQKVDPRSDLYSVGVVLYQAITGRVPFNAETFNELVFKIALESPEPAETVVPSLDRGFAEIINKSMQRDANHRYQTAHEFQMAIGNWMARNQVATSSGQYPAMMGGGGGVVGVVPQQAPHLGQSGQQAHTPLAQSGAGLGQSGAGLGQSGNQSGNALGQSGPMGQSGPFGASQVGLAVTGSQPKRGNAVVLFGLIAAVLGVGGGFVAYTQFGGQAAANAGGGETVAEGPKSGGETAETAEDSDTAAPEGDPAEGDPAEETGDGGSGEAPKADATAAPTATAVAAAPPPPPPVVRAPPPPPGRTPPPPPPPPPTKKKGGGRQVGSEL